MKRKENALRMLTAGVLSAALLAGPVQAAGPEFRVSSYKGDTLPVGTRSGLIVGPEKDAVQAVTSSNPAVVTIENVRGFWVAVTHTEGVAEITAVGKTSETASLTLTVGTPTETNPSAENTTSVPGAAPLGSSDITASIENAELRLEMIRLINEVRQENGVPDLTMNMALMNAAQEHAARQYTSHHRKEECKTAAAHGYPHGFGCNLTAFTGVAPAEISRRAVENWKNSSGHFRTMIDPDYDTIGVGIVTVDGWTYCYLFAGNPNSYNPYT